MDADLTDPGHTDGGKAIIITAPSGAGKTTVVQFLLKHFPDFAFSVSACTRAQRSHEVHGKDYYFIDLEEFKAKILNEDFIEYQEVYKDQFYGTLKSEAERLWKMGKVILFDVDVLGALNLKKYLKNNALAIFLSVPSVEVLEKRLRNRQTETEESIQKRLAKYPKEMAYQNEFDKVVINIELEDTLTEVDKIVSAFLSCTEIKSE